MTRGMLRENGTTKGQNLRSACMDMLYAAGQKFPAFSGHIYYMNRTPPPPFCYCLFLYIMILLYLSGGGVYAIKKYAISGKKFSPPTHRVVRILKNAPHISQKPANARSHLPVFSFVSIRTAAWISGSFGFVRFAGFRRLAVACLLPG